MSEETRGRIVVTSGNFKPYPIQLCVNIELDKDKNIGDIKSLRVGRAAGGSSCQLVVQDVSEIDILINRLLEIRHEISSQQTENK